MILALLAACASGPTIDSTPYAGVLLRADLDHDGALSAAEYEAAAPPVATSFSEADLDHDARLTRDEIALLTHHTDPAWYDPALAPKERGGKRGAHGRPAGKAGDGKKGGKAGEGAEPPAGAKREEVSLEGPGSGFDGSGPPLARGHGDAHKDKGGAGKKASAAGKPGGKEGAPRPGPAGAGAPSGKPDFLLEALRFEVAEVRAVAPGAALPDDAAVQAAAEAGLASPEAATVVAALRAAAESAGLGWPASLTP